MAEKEKTATDGEGEATNTTEATTETEPKVRKDIVPPQYRKQYAELGGNNGDFIAAELSAMMESGGIDSLNTVKAENDIAKGTWSGLNNGQQRMNLSNRLRAAFLRGETIKIAGKEFNINALNDEFGGVKPLDEKNVDKFLSFISMPTTKRNRDAIVRVFHTLPEKARLRAEREETAEKNKAEKAAKKEAEKAKKDAAAKEAKEGADKPAKAKGKAKADKEPATAEA